MTEEEKNKLREEMRRNIQNEFFKIDLFWEKEYPTYTFNEKVGYWSESINRQMRWQGESGLDEYAIFSKSWYQSILEKEPDFDLIIDKAFEQFLSWNWDKNEYLKRIGKV